MNRPIKITGRLVLLFLLAGLLLSCNMTGISNPFTSLADGGALPSNMAIASGNPVLMWECYLQVRADYDSGDLDSREKLQAALDMVDLLAVLSQAIKALAPYFLEGQPPSDLSNVGDFLSSSAGDYLARIGGDSRIVSIVQSDNASPMQLLWCSLGLYAYLYDYYMTDVAGNITDEEYHQILDWIDGARQAAADAGNTEMVDLLNQLETAFTDEVPDPDDT